MPINVGNVAGGAGLGLKVGGIPGMIAGGILGGLFGDDEGDTAARDAANAQRDIANAQWAVAAEQWNLWKQNFLPVAQAVSKKALEPVAPDYATVERMAGEGVKQAADRAWREYSRKRGDVSGTAWNPGSENYQTAARQWGNDVAANQALARQVARTAEKYRVEDIGWNRPLQALSLGQGLPAQVGALGTAAGTMFGQSANTALNLANLRNQNTMLGTYSLGRALDNWNRPAISGMDSPYQYGYDPNSGAVIDAEGYGWRADGGPVGEPAPAGEEKPRAIYLSDGGMVHGGGSGRSDSIKAAIPKGAYVIPADVVKAKGTDFFDKLHGLDGPVAFRSGALGAPVKVSDGEYVVAPGVVKKKGIEFFNKLLENYHTPARNGNKGLPPAIEQAIRGGSPHRALRRQ